MTSYCFRLPGAAESALARHHQQDSRTARCTVPWGPRQSPQLVRLAPCSRFGKQTRTAVAAAASVEARPEQLWDKLRSDADSAYGHASELIKRTENAESAADAAAGKLETAKRAEGAADSDLREANSAAQKALQAASDALAGSFASQQGCAPGSLASLANSRLDRWQQAHPSASSFQRVSRIESQAAKLEDVSLVGQVASVKADGRPYAVVAIAVGSSSGQSDLEGVQLHWACVSGQGQEWQQPPPGWHTDPDYSHGAGKAWQTPLGRYAGQPGSPFAGRTARAVVVQIPLEGVLSRTGGIQFVLKRAQGTQPDWLSGPDNKDFFVSLNQAINVAGQTKDSNTEHAPITPPAPKERALIPAGMDKHAKKALWEQRKTDRARARQANSNEETAEGDGAPIGTSEDWVVVDSGKSFAWSAKQHGTLQQQFDAIEKLVQHQMQQEASEGLAMASAALDSARPLVREAEQAQQKLDMSRHEAEQVRRESSRARSEQQSIQAEAEAAVRTARQASCHLKGRDQEITLADLSQVAHEEQKAWFDQTGARQQLKGTSPQRSTYRIQSIDGSVVAHESVCKEGSQYFAIITMAAGEAFDDGALDETSLHWACTPRQGGPWQAPPPGWTTEPSNSHDAGGGAHQTPLKRIPAPAYLDRPDIAVHAVTIQVLLQGSLLTGGIAFVLKTGQQQWLACRAEGVLRADFFISTQEAADSVAKSQASASANGNQQSASSAGSNGASSDSHSNSAVSNGSTSHSSSSSDVLRKQGGVGTNKWQGAVAEQTVKDISQAESKAERSLMHRFNLAREFLLSATKSNRSAEEEEAALTAVVAWLRLSSSRLLTWNKNYNIKPREISTAQDGLTALLADLLEQRPEWRDLLLVGLAAVGRGGQGDVGQRIRDEILYVQSRNNAKGGMMEEWHQKLHNNTSPDDVVICQALIAYLEHDLDITHYWATLQAANITKERLASYDRAIRSEPSFQPSQQQGLLTDLTNYLQTLMAVHSGADLQSAANAVLGYDQVSMKGKAIKVEPVPGVATAQLKTLVEAVLPKAEQGHKSAQADRLQDAGVASTMQRVQGLLRVRWELVPALARGSQGCAGRLRDVVYLDLALEGAVRSTVESALGAQSIESGHEEQEQQTQQLIALTALCAENVFLSAGSNAELIMVHKDYEACKLLNPPLNWLRAQAASERLTRELSDVSERNSSVLQPTATALGQALGLPQESTAIFAEEVIRGTPAAPLAQLSAVLAPNLRQLAGLDSWQIISPGTGFVKGMLKLTKSLTAVESLSHEAGTVLLVEHIGGEEDIPQGVAGVISKTAPDVLCHAAVRARNSNVMLVACHDEEELAGIAEWKGQQVQLQLSQGNTMLKASLASDSPQPLTASSSPSSTAAATGRVTSNTSSTGSKTTSAVSKIVRRQWCEQYAIGADDFSSSVVGAKSLNTQKLKGQLPSWVKLPCSAALPFGAFEACCSHPANAAVDAAVQELTQAAPSAKQLLEVQSKISTLQAPADMQQQVKAAMHASGIAWDGSSPNWDSMWAAIKAVWASKWNSRAVSSLQKAGLQHKDLQMAVLCQPLIAAQYAFVAHTTNPTTGSKDDIYLELVQGLGEALVGNLPGSAFRVTISKSALSSLAASLENEQKLESLFKTVPEDVITICAYPSKSLKLVLPDEALASKSRSSSAYIFRSDSNGEDLEGYAGAGLFDSIHTMESQEAPAGYSEDRLLMQGTYQQSMLVKLAVVCMRIEQLMGSAQDIEGVIDYDSDLHIVQSRPQV